MSHTAPAVNIRAQPPTVHFLWIALGVAVTVAGSTLASEPTAAEPVAAVTIDLEARRAEAEAAEHGFNLAAKERDRQSFHDLLAKDSVFLAGELHSGRLAVMAIWQHLFDGKYDFRYEAEAATVAVAGSGELAWAVGAVTTSFQRPGVDSKEVTEGHYLHVWTRGEGGWRLAYASSLVVHPTLGAARDPRSGLMTAWPELADQIDARIDIRWAPSVSVRAVSGELAYTFGEYEASFLPPSAGTSAPARDESAATLAGKGNYLAVWHKDDQDRWQLAAEGFTPPGIYRSE